MPIETVTPVLNISSMAESFVWFEKLGWVRSFTWNGGGLLGEGAQAAVENEHGPADFGGICAGDATIFLCVDGQGARGSRDRGTPEDDQTGGVWMSWWVSSKDEVDRLHQVAADNNYVVTYLPNDEPWGVREFHLRHPDGHIFRISAGLDVA